MCIRDRDEVVACAKVCTFVCDDGDEFVPGESGHDALTQHDALPNAGQAVGEWLLDVDHADIATEQRMRLIGAVASVEDVDELAMRRPSSTGAYTDANDREDQAGADEQREREDAHIGNPQRKPCLLYTSPSPRD